MGNQFGFEKSFYDWCIENNLKNFLDLWDYKLNNENPNKIGFKSNRKFYFKCNKGIHKSELHNLNKIILLYEKFNTPIKCKQCNSFAQWGVDNLGKDFLDKYWDYEKNTVDPYVISFSSGKKVWIKCQEKYYHGSYNVSCSNFIKGNRCGFCACKKVHPKDSFAQYHIDNTDKDFIEKYWSKKNKINPFTIPQHTNKKVWIKCQEKKYHDDYLINCDKFTIGKRCCYCAGRKVNYYDSLGYLYPQVIEIWSDKNKKSPYEYMPFSQEKVWLSCLDDIHEDYSRDIHNIIKYNFRCPQCVKERTESFLQEKVRKYIDDNYNFTLKHEYNCSLIVQNPKESDKRYQMPFDNEVVELNLIIEVHGKQHYELSKWHKVSAKHNNTTPEQELHYQKLKDRYKRFIAYYRGYFYLEIPYWTEKDESYKQLIDNKIQEICLSKNFKEAV